MPMEGHWQRVNQPLRKLTSRERTVAIGATVATLIAIIVLVVAASGTTRPAPGPGCIRASVPGVMGALEINDCGRRAKRTCADHIGHSDAGSLSIQEACRRAGVSS